MSQAPAKPSSAVGPIRRSILRGLAVILPPLLTIVVFIWAWTVIDANILVPAEGVAGRLIVWSIRDVKATLPADAVRHLPRPGQPTRATLGDTVYVQLDSGKWIPESVWAKVQDNPGAVLPTTPDAYYDRYVKVQHLRRERTLPIFLLVFVCLLYLTGKVMAAGVGRFAWRVGEGIVHRMPIVRNVYSAVKQITDYVFNEQEVQFLRVVAVEYPRKGLWTIAFVTGEGFKDIYKAAGEPILSLLVPTSPMPATGFTCTVAKSEVLDLDITVDQAVQYIVSCGVVIPPHQQWANGDRLRAEIEQQIRDQGSLARPA